MDKALMARCFNEWMRRYTEEPEKFATEFETVGEFLAQTSAGTEPSYGHVSAEYLEKLAAEIDQASDQIIL